MNFSDALTALKSGNKVCRSGWNGKGMWIVLVEPVTHPKSGYSAYINYDPLGKGTVSELMGPTLPFIAMKTADNTLVPWLASQTDILSEDWEILK